MKVDVSSKPSPLMDQNSSSPPKSAFARLCRKLSPKRSSDHQKPSVCVNSDEDKSPARNSKPSSCCSMEMERLFRYFDSDGDGKVSPAELQSCARAVGGELSVAEAESAVQGLDSDGDGLLGLDDFAKLMEASGGEEKEREELREAFEMYEMDRSGCVTPKSLKRMLSRLGESRTVEECRGMISAFDVNGDGVLSFEEFRAMMR